MRSFLKFVDPKRSYKFEILSDLQIKDFLRHSVELLKTGTFGEVQIKIFASRIISLFDTTKGNRKNTNHVHFGGVKGSIIFYVLLPLKFRYFRIDLIFTPLGKSLFSKLYQDFRIE